MLATGDVKSPNLPVDGNRPACGLPRPTLMATRTDRAGAVPETRVMASNYRPAGSGKQPLGITRRARKRPRTRGRRLADALGADRPPPIPREALALVVTLALAHASICGASRLQLSIHRAGSARAWREPQASALEAVEKLVTTRAGARRASGEDGRVRVRRSRRP
jgi:hypothetical protein